MQILKNSEKYLIFTGLGINSTIQIAGRCIPRVVPQFYVISICLLCVVLKFRFCVLHYVDGLEIVLLEFGIGITYVSLLLIYISLMFKSGQIIDLFHLTQNVTNQSE